MRPITGLLILSLLSLSACSLAGTIRENLGQDVFCEPTFAPTKQHVESGKPSPTLTLNSTVVVTSSPTSTPTRIQDPTLTLTAAEPVDSPTTGPSFTPSYTPTIQATPTVHTPTFTPTLTSTPFFPPSYADFAIFRGGSINQLAFSIDGKTLGIATSSGIYLYAEETLEQLRTLDDGAQVNSLLFLPGENVIASGGLDGTIHYWNTATGDSLHSFQAHRLGVSALASTRDGRILASGDDEGTLRLWDTTTFLLVTRTVTSTLRMTYDEPINRVTDLAIGHNGTRVVASSNHAVHVWNINTLELVNSYMDYPGWVNGIAFGPDGISVMMAVDAAEIHLWDIESGEVKSIISAGDNRQTLLLSYSRASRILATGGTDGVVRLWSVSYNNTEGEIKIEPLYTLERQRSVITHLEFNFDGDVLASSSADGTVRLWRFED